MRNIVQSPKAIHCPETKYAIHYLLHLVNFLLKKVYVLNQCTAASTASSSVITGSSDSASIAVTTPDLRPGMGPSDSMELLRSQYLAISICVSV